MLRGGNFKETAFRRALFGDAHRKSWRLASSMRPRHLRRRNVILGVSEKANWHAGIKRQNLLLSSAVLRSAVAK